MYNTKYALPVDIGDYSKLVDIYHNSVPKNVMPVYRYTVGSELDELRSANPWLGDYIDYFVIYPGTTIGIHTDGYQGHSFRAVVCNIPILNPLKTYTSWYVMPEDTEWYDPWAINNEGKTSAYKNGISLWAKPEYKPLDIPFELETVEPIIFNTKEPHSIKNIGSAIRVLASWHTKFNDYEQAKNYFNNSITDKQ